MRSCITLLLVFPAAIAFGQSSAAGIATRYSTFDPMRGRAGRRALSVARASSSAPQPPQLDSTPGGEPRQGLAGSATVSFPGIAQTQYSPPSPNIAAGPVDILEVVNASVARFSKEGVMTDSVPLSQWFAANYPTLCPSASVTCPGDVQIRYDQIHGRFLMTLQFRDDFATDATGGHTGNSNFAISVSNGATYASGWKNWILNAQFDGSTPTQNWADFPQLGFDDKAVYLTALMYDAASKFKYSKLRILKKSDLYDARATALPYKDLVNFQNEDGTTFLTLQPVHMRGRVGSGPPGAILISAADDPASPADYLTLWTINDPLGNPTATRTAVHGMWKYTLPAPVPQLGNTVMLDTGFASVLKAIYRDGVIYTAQNVGYPDEPATVVYTRLDAAGSALLAQTRWTNGSFFYPSFDVPASVGPGPALPNQLIAGTTTSAGGALTYAGLIGVKDGEGFFAPSGGPVARWGDYFGAGIDPVNGGLWTTGEYAKALDGEGMPQYGTWVSYFPWTTAAQFSDVSPTSPHFDFINVLSMWKITTGCGAGTFCPGSPVSRGQMAVFIVRSVFGDQFPFPSTAYFTDVPSTHPYFAYIQKLRQLGITQGCSATTFCPDASITRSEAAVFIVRAKLGSLFGDSFSYPATAYFSDVPSTDGRFPFIQKLRELGITQGCSPTTFCPNQAIPREQMATFLVRAFLN
jgi:S-layer homology domain